MIDFKFIQAREGLELKGYVPKPDGGPVESGVTVASGFDIGQRSVEQIDDMFGYELADKLAPYCGVVGHDAVELITKRPLKITEDEAEEINRLAHKEAVNLLLADWNKATKTPFHSLSDECQTVVASVAFQYGDLPTRTPNFWRQVTAGDWWGALANLRNFGDRFKTRRNIEADLLESRLLGEL